MYGNGVKIGLSATVEITKSTPRDPILVLFVLVVAVVGLMICRTVVFLIVAAASLTSVSAISVSGSLVVQTNVELRVKNYELRVLSLLFIAD